MVQTSFLNKYTTSVLISICKAHRYIDDIICQGCHLSKIAEMTSYFYFHIIAIFYPDRRVWNLYRKKVLIMPKKKKKTMAVHEIVLEKFYQKLLKTKAVPKCTDRKHEAKMEFVTPNTIRNVNKLLRSCFNQAMRWDLIEKNPAKECCVYGPSGILDAL